jgi:hypothetical protein
MDVNLNSTADKDAVSGYASPFSPLSNHQLTTPQRGLATLNRSSDLLIPRAITTKKTEINIARHGLGWIWIYRKKQADHGIDDQLSGRLGLLIS